MNCIYCGTPLSDIDYCTGCGADITILKRVARISNLLYNEGLDKARVRDLSGAIKSLKRSLEFNKENKDARNLLGLVYFESGEVVSALTEWVISKNMNPDDNLAEYYTDKQLPGVGISIGLTRLFYVLGEQGMLNPELPTAPADALILPMTEDLSPAIALATQLRQAGIRTQLHCEEKKFKAKMSYADKLSIPYVIFLGEEEIASGVAAVKNMRTGEQVKVSPDEAVKLIQAGLELLNQGTPIVDKE